MEQQEWEELVERFKKHFRKVEHREESVVFDSGSSMFKLSRSGEVEAEMPLHRFRVTGFDHISFKKAGVEVRKDSVEYEFRK